MIHARIESQESQRKPFVLGPVVVLMLGLLLVACGEPTPTPFPTETPPPVTETPSPTDTSTPVPLETYENREGAFLIDLPADWRVERRGETSLGTHYWVGPEPLDPGPGSSAFFVADAGTLSSEEAAEVLHCGGGCAEEITLEETTLGGRAAQQATLAEERLEWYFVENDGQLLILTLHDPLTLATRNDLLETLAFSEAAAAEATNATATPTRASTPTPTLDLLAVEPVESWDRVAVAEAGLSFEAPAAWQEVEEMVWSPDGQGALRLAFSWQQTGPESAPADLLPGEADIAAVEPLTASWSLALTATTGISATLQTAGRWQRHAVIQVGLRTYDFYASGERPEALFALHPAWAHMVDSVVVNDLFLYVGNPVNGSVAWFRALLQDPSGEAALPYMSASLRDAVPEGESPLALLALDAPILNFNLQWVSATEDTTVLEAMITLAGGAEVQRTVTMVNVGEAGWRVDAVEVPPMPEESESMTPPADE